MRIIEDHPSTLLHQWLVTRLITCTCPGPSLRDLGLTHLPRDDVQRGLFQLVLGPGTVEPSETSPGDLDYFAIK